MKTVRWYSVVISVIVLLGVASLAFGQQYDNPNRIPYTGVPKFDRIIANTNAMNRCMEDCERSYPPNTGRRVDPCYQQCREQYTR